MRLIKMFGLTAIATVAAMAFVGASSASATVPTQLCLSHTALTCGAGQAATSVSMTNVGVVTLLTDDVDILCLNASGTATTAGTLANPQSFAVTSLTFTNCGTQVPHINCTVTTEVLPAMDLLKLGLDEGSLEALNGRIRLVCSNVPFFGKIDCKYKAAGLLFLVAAQHLTATETEVEEEGSKFFCPDNPTLDGLLKTDANRYILG